ncbi:Ssy5p Ecym_5178 [Eremothecium cymbalariae DBVPG|uniref:SPS-sensor serine protease component SSY5 n=1 Tax=Eremothecium cymbalariae (strain CBS 270.75 / DBVPG 7215 / KCTC 17166 / NRRL Y-17582) TaxID=931890 RepID=I6ND09_ERECY|nr:hypothetical protein Ecym_5178 [Eremothecium cymbalariae DBVPG\
MAKRLLRFYKKPRGQPGNSSQEGQSGGSDSRHSGRESGKAQEDDVPGVLGMGGEVFSSTASVQSSSIFSKSGITYGTDNSSNISGSAARKQTGALADNEDVGKPLRVVGVENFGEPLHTVIEQDEEDREQGVVVGSSSRLDATEIGVRRGFTRGVQQQSSSDKFITMDQVEMELRVLQNKLDTLVDDIHQNVKNISKAVIQAIEYFKEFLPDVRNLLYRVSMERCLHLRNITKVVLHFQDNLLQSDVYNNSRSILLRRYMEFLGKLNVNIYSEPLEATAQHTLPTMKVFAIGEDCHLPNKNKISSIIDEIAHVNDGSTSDQEGAYIAPLLRGLSKSSAILTIMFGFPNPQQEHYDLLKVLYSLFSDVHFYCVKDYITPCASEVASVLRHSKPMQAVTTQSSSQFIPPYKLPTDVMVPPISMSLSAEDSLKITGTLGGYLYPQIAQNDSAMSKFAGSTFAITCAHVVLTESQDHPHVCAPSKVLQTTYKKALLEESKQYPEGSIERSSFMEEIRHIEENLKWQQNNKFGQVVWGERTIINQKLSDFAIIKVNSNFCCQNHLGEDLTGLPDPALRFQNLYVKKTIVDLKPGLNVFKIGASSNYTRGNINGSKIVYWADGKIQSSEFVISSPRPLFATGGDSGSWILTKLDGELGLGVVGMLHSYDGEQKQFGLFTSIVDIIERLHDVTGVLWDIEPPTDL